MPYQMMVLVIKDLASVCSGNKLYLQSDSKRELFRLLIDNQGFVNGVEMRYQHGAPTSIFYNEFLPFIRKNIAQPIINERDLEVYVFEGSCSVTVRDRAIEFAELRHRKDRNPRVQANNLHNNNEHLTVEKHLVYLT